MKKKEILVLIGEVLGSRAVYSVASLVVTITMLSGITIILRNDIRDIKNYVQSVVDGDPNYKEIHSQVTGSENVIRGNIDLETLLAKEDKKEEKKEEETADWKKELNDAAKELSVYTQWMEKQSLVIKILLAIPLLDISWGIYRLFKALAEKDSENFIVKLIVAILLLVPGTCITWLIDIVWILLKGNGFWF